MIGQNLKQTRINADLTQEQLGALIGISKQSVCDIEKGRSSGSVKIWQQAALVLGVGLSDLLGEPKSSRTANTN